jgi:Tol biopolymer transport system component
LCTAARKGQTASIFRAESVNQNIWARDIQRGVTTRLSFDPALNNLPIWSPDELRVLWSSNRNGGAFNLVIKSATGTGQEELLVKMGTPSGWATDWSRDGRFILYQVPGAKTGQDLWIAPQFGDRKPFPYLQGQYDEQNGVFSPDGHRIAYSSNESGKDEVYVQSFPLSEGKWQISTGGGSEPKWRNDGTELFYVAPDRALMAAPIRTTGASFEPGVPKRLFPVPLVTWVVSRDQFAVSNDGNRFLISRPAGEAPATPITVVLNWQAQSR